MHVHELGSRSDVPVLFWHALGPDASGADVAPVAPSIAAAGYRVLAVDGPGFRRSPARAPEDYGLGALVEALHDLVDDRDLERPVLMGHSWGGAVAVRYAGAFPDDVRALVLSTAVTSTTEICPTWISTKRWATESRRFASARMGGAQKHAGWRCTG